MGSRAETHGSPSCRHRLGDRAILAETVADDAEQSGCVLTRAALGRPSGKTIEAWEIRRHFTAGGFCV